MSGGVAEVAGEIPSPRADRALGSVDYCMAWTVIERCAGDVAFFVANGSVR